MDTPMLSDELLAALLVELEKGASITLARPQATAALSELREHRAGKLVPEGKALVDEADLRALIAGMAIAVVGQDYSHADECPVGCPAHDPEMCCEANQVQCERAWLARFGLAPEE